MQAGGLGIITGLTPGSPEALRAEIKKCRTLTDKPFAVNLTFLPSMNPPPYEQYAKVIIEEGVKIAETAGSGAAAPCVKMFKDAGICACAETVARTRLTPSRCHPQVHK